MRITLTGAGITNQDAATSAALDGPGPIVHAAGGAPHLGNGYAVFQRATLYSGGAILDQKNFLNDEMNLMLMHNSNSAYLSTDAALLLGCGASFNVVSATSSFIDLVLPLPFSIFQSSTQDFPAYLLSAPLTIQLDLASVARAIFGGATAAVSEYTVSNTFLLFQSCEIPNEMIQAERQAVKSSPFIMNCTNTMAVQVPQSVLTSYTLGLNASSIRGAAVLPTGVDAYTYATRVNYVRNVGDTNGAGVGVNNQIYLDGSLISSNIIDNVANTYHALKQMLHHCVQGNILQPSPIVAAANPALTGAVSSVTGLNSYCTQYYAVGWDTTSFDSEGTLMGGLPATNVNIALTGYNAAGSSNFLCTVLIFYDVLIAFGEDGSISLKR